MPPGARPTANPDELEAKAKRIRAEADVLAKSLDPFDRAVHSSSWQGIAAASFHDDADTKQRAARTLADQLRQVARALEDGAGEIRRYLRELQSQKERQLVPPGPR
jgi:uncharacterized protein YukE